MASEPSDEVLDALRMAATKTGVPLSLLWGIAFAESSFDPTKVGPKTPAGTNARGLMQLTPQIVKRYGVTDPFDPRQSALAAAQLLAALGKATGWNVPDMLTGYVWGPTNYARAKAQGQPIPKDVLVYMRRALAAQTVYRGKADRPAGTITIALNKAIERLAELNPLWSPATTVRDAWRSYFAMRRDDSDTSALANPELRSQWRGYRIAYERAPITDATTPRPELVEPDLWKAAANKLDRVKSSALEFAEDTALGVGAGLFCLAVFWFAVSGRRR